MKSMRGVILLEALISIMISSMIFMSLMAAMFQLSKARITVDDSIDIHTRVSTIFDLMQQDFGGVTIPVQAEFPADKTQKPTTGEQQKEEPKIEEKNTTEPSGQATEKKEKPVKNIFHSTLKNNNIDMISCITNNPTAIYWSERAGKAKPRVVRIVYTLAPDPEHKESFLLKRQEGTELDLDAYKKPESPAARAYEVAEGIKELKISYLYLEKKEETQTQQPSALQKNGTPKETPKDSATKKETPEKPDYKIKTDWGNGKEKDGENAQKKEPLFPLFMVVSLTMFNSTYKKDYPFEFVIALHANETQQINQAKMRYKEAETKLTETQNPAGVTTPGQSQTKEPNLPELQEPIGIVVFNREPAQTVIQKTPGTPVTTHDMLADNIVQKNIEQFYEQITKEERGENNQLNDNNGNPEALNDSDTPDQIDMPEGKIDIVHDDDTNTTHIVYQGPITITPEILQGFS